MHWFTNLRTRSKLIIGFGFVIALLLGIVVTAWFSLDAVYEAESSIGDVMAMRNNLNGQRAALFGAALSPPGPEVESRLQEVADYSTNNTEVLQRLADQYGRDAELRTHIEQITAVRAEYVRARDTEVISLIRQQKKEEAIALLLGSQSDRFEDFRVLARDFTKRLNVRSAARLEQAHLVFVILGAVALLVAVAMIISLNRLIARPLEMITAAAEKIADGDIHVELPDTDRKDEVGTLLQTFQRMCRSLGVLANRARQITEGDLTAQITPRSERDVLGTAFAAMTDNLRRVISDLVEAVNVLASSSSEIMASTAQLASGAAETAAAVSETTTTVEEVKQASQISSQKAKYVSDQAQKMTDISQSGRKSVGQTINEMTGIRQQIGAVAESILSLSAQGQAIGEIIATVDDLAAQSKLLAVNASIEAAKAGEEGRGFSVVAQEVRILAEQSKQATTQVRSILHDIQKATSHAVLATEQATKTVETAVRQSTAAGDSIGSLAGNVSEAAQAATQIAATSQEQFVGMDQVALAMENIKLASTQTVVSTKQAEAAAQQLHELGQRLIQIVERFKI